MQQHQEIGAAYHLVTGVEGLHGLPVDSHAQFTVLVATYKALYRLEIKYLRDHLLHYLPGL